MKRLSLFLISLLLMVACGTAEGSKEESTETNESAASLSSVQKADGDTNGGKDAEKAKTQEERNEPKEVVEIPTERTTDIGVHYPWQYYHIHHIEELQEKGEVVYLYSDAEALEDMILSQAENEVGGEVDANIFELFIKEVREIVPDRKEYFDKMQEVIDLHRVGEYGKIPQLIEEAKQLRESE